MLLSLARTLFIPIFLACNVGGMASHGHPPSINSDIVYFLILILFFMTNGCVRHLISVPHADALQLGIIAVYDPCIIADLQPAYHRGRKGRGGHVASFCLVAGLAVGSVASFGVGALIHGR